MIPKQVSEIADALEPGWSEENDEFAATVISAAWRVYNAGFRRVEEPVAATP